jgi:hypothetical protein
MTNVRIDENGMAKTPIFDPTAPLSHRSAVAAVDSSDPEESAGIDTVGYQGARFDVDIGGVDFTSLEVQVLFWSSRLSDWFGGGKRLFTGTGRHATTAICRGPKVYLKVTAFTGTSFTLSADYVLCPRVQPTTMEL